MPNPSGAIETADFDDERTTGAPNDPDLAAVVNAWPTLPDPIRRAVLALVEAVGKGGERNTVRHST